MMEEKGKKKKKGKGKGKKIKGCVLYLVEFGNLILL